MTTSEVIEVGKINIEGCRVLFDANIWIIINGLCGGGPGRRVAAYSNAYDHLLKKKNRIVVNDYVLGEIANRSTKFEYQLAKQANPQIDSYKKYRQRPEFAPKMKFICDTCLDIVRSCEFVQVGRSKVDIVNAINEFCSGRLDFSDVILAEHCVQEGCYFMTDDADFNGSGLRLITANRRLISQASGKP